MITRIEIDGFKSFDGFVLDLQPFTAVVGPNASGKSNLFDALKFISALSQDDIRSAMQALRGEPTELLRKTAAGTSNKMTFAVEVFLQPDSIDAFGQVYHVNAQRLRYEVALGVENDRRGRPVGIRLLYENCAPIHKRDEKQKYIRDADPSYSYRKTPFMNTHNEGRAVIIEVRQDGTTETGTSRRGRPMRIAAQETTRTALSAISNAEFPHLYALKELLSSINFLEINPRAARSSNDRFEDKKLRSDASNLAAVLAYLKDITADSDHPEGCLTDISVDLSSLISSVSRVEVEDDADSKEYNFDVIMADGVRWSSRVISDGTLRLLALLAILDDPYRSGILCFEEPENGVHEGRIGSLVELLRDATVSPENGYPPFQILINTHSPAVLQALDDDEIVVADTVKVVGYDGQSYHKTRMRTGVKDGVLEIDPERIITRSEINRILKRREGRV